MINECTKNGCFVISKLVSGSAAYSIQYASNDFTDIIKHLQEGIENGKYTFSNGIESNFAYDAEEEHLFIIDVIESYQEDNLEADDSAILSRINASLWNCRVRYIPFWENINMYI